MPINRKGNRMRQLLPQPKRHLRQEVVLLDNDGRAIAHGIIVGQTIEAEPLYDITCTRGRYYPRIPERRISTAATSHRRAESGGYMGVKKKDEGVFWRRGDDHRIVYYYKIGKSKSKDFLNRRDCAMEYIERFCGQYPKYEELCVGKTWDQCFAIFSIDVSTR